MNIEREDPGHRNECWGGFATVGFGIVIAVFFLGIQILLFSMFAGFELTVDPDVHMKGIMTRLENDGFFISVFSCTATVFCLPLIFLIIKLKRGASLTEYLGIKFLSGKAFVFWFTIILGLIVIADILFIALGRPIVPEFMSIAYDTATHKLLFWIALVIAAPLLEETFFRGFLLQGFKSTFFGPLGAILITSLCWTVIHVQYDLFELSLIFIMGIFFGYARLRTDSLLICIALHGFVNFVATLETAISVTSSVT